MRFKDGGGFVTFASDGGGEVIIVGMLLQDFVGFDEVDGLKDEVGCNVEKSGILICMLGESEGKVTPNAFMELVG